MAEQPLAPWRREVAGGAGVGSPAVGRAPRKPHSRSVGPSSGGAGSAVPPPPLHAWVPFLRTLRSGSDDRCLYDKKQQMSNSSSTTQFLLLAFTDTRELQLLHFWLFLGIYLAALLGNGLIITTIAWDQHLHTPITAVFACLKPPSISSPLLDLMVSVLYSVVPPAVNPLIYSMRNQELKGVLWKLFEYSLFQQ
ncbi:hypothetical protein AV530_007042 [Patagioenas fasciata monilis]|uniref:G-protein coupled receptors family 1 profile domain-containing protein n=1 Tax=Patagioenas fasciata monilis TaxID=372326 RepID=A0A1V4JAU5_PATFA|nr:hypothetical protein AV530_007042 [Patagioenas fasciata monilis]